MYLTSHQHLTTTIYLTKYNVKCSVLISNYNNKSLFDLHYIYAVFVRRVFKPII